MAGELEGRSSKAELPMLCIVSVDMDGTESEFGLHVDLFGMLLVATLQGTSLSADTQLDKLCVSDPLRLDNSSASRSLGKSFLILLDTLDCNSSYDSTR